MINAIVIDDEPINVINLQRLLEQHCPAVQIVQTAYSAAEGITAIRTYTPDLVFLDIQMPDKNGFDMLRQLNDDHFELIFVTAYDQYGIQAVKFAAMDYLLKPVNSNDLITAVNKAADKIALKKQNQHLQHLLQMLQPGQIKQEQRIALPSLKETRFVYIRDIVRLESANSYTHFFMNGGEKIIVSAPLYEYEELLTPHGFIRSHQSHLVNKLFVKSLVKESGGYLLLLDGTQVPISRHKKEAIKKELL